MIKVAGVDLEKLDRKHLEAVARGFGLRCTGASNTILVEKVSEQLVEMCPEDELLQCDNCGGGSPPEMSKCPYCGEQDGGVEAETIEPADEDGVEAETIEAVEEAPPPPASLATVPSSRLALKSEADLDAVVGRIQQLKQGSLRFHYDFACEVRKVRDQDLWKLRTTKGGGAAYKTWGDFCRSELEISIQYADNLVRIATQYSREQVEGVGPSKLILIMQAPAESQADLLKAAKQREMDREQLRAKAQELNLATGKPPKKTKPRKEKARPAPVPDRPEEITLATLIGKKQSVPLVQPKKGPDGNFLPAKKIEQQPWGWFDLQNQVRLVFRIAHYPSGQLKLTFEAKREEV